MEIQASQEPQPTAATATSAQGQSGATARPDGDGPEDTVSRTLRQKATYENLKAFYCLQILRTHAAADFNRRMRKTARPVGWEGAGAQSPAPDPFKCLQVLKCFRERNRSLTLAAR